MPNEHPIAGAFCFPLTKANLMTLTAYRAGTVYADAPVTLTDTVQGVIRGYVWLWGSPDGANGVGRDSYDTFFDVTRPPNYSASGSLRGYPVCLEHGQEGANTHAIGMITETWFDDKGLAFEAQLDKSDPRFARTVERVLAGVYKTSSSSAEHMADFYEDGAFHSWMMTELSLVENPSQAEMPPVSLVRSNAEGERDAHRADASGHGDTSHSEAVPTMENTDMNPTDEAMSVEQAVAQLLQQFSVEDVMAVLAQLQAPAAPAPESAPEALGSPAPVAQFPRGADFLARATELLNARAQANTIAKLQAEMKALQDAQTAANNAPPTNDATRAAGQHIGVSEPRRFAYRSTNDLMLAYQLLKSREFIARGVRPSDELVNTMSGRALDELQGGKNQFVDPAVRSAFPRATRAGEVATSTASGGGDDWVSIAWSSTAWDVARDNRIYDDLVSRGMRVEEVPQGAESVYVPTVGADPTVYTIAQDADLAASGRPDVNVGATRIGTGRVLLTPGEIGLAVVYSDVFEEDSVLNVSTQYNRQIQEKMAETVEQLFINGDTQTSTTNINYDDGTPGTGLATPYYIASNGAIKYALVTGSNTSRDAGGLDENDYRLTTKLLPSAIRSRLNQMVYIIDPDTHSASLDIAAVKTDDVRRTNATITSGVLSNIYGIDVVVSGFMLLAAADGKVTYNAAGTLGRILNVYAPYWAVANKRQVTIETDRDILSGTNLIVAKMRIGFMPRGAGAATISYNVTV